MSSVERAGVLKFWPVMRMLRMEQRAVARLAVGRCCIFAGGYRPAEGVADQIRLLASMPIENAAESWRRAQNSASNSSISSGSDSGASFSAADTIRGRRRPDALLPGPAGPKGAEVDLRGRPRHGSRHLQDRGRSDLALPAQKVEMLFRAPQTHPQARSAPISRAKWCSRRIPPRRHHAEPPQTRQAGSRSSSTPPRPLTIAVATIQKPTCSAESPRSSHYRREREQWRGRVVGCRRRLGRPSVSAPTAVVRANPIPAAHCGKIWPPEQRGNAWSRPTQPTQSLPAAGKAVCGTMA